MGGGRPVGDQGFQETKKLGVAASLRFEKKRDKKWPPAEKERKGVKYF